MKPAFVFRTLFFLLMAAILVLSLLPISHPSASPNDKVNHFIAYGTLTFVGCLGFVTYWRIALVAVVWGVMIEGLQGLTSYRFLSYADVLANTAGAGLGWAAIVFGQRIRTYFRTRQG